MSDYKKALKKWAEKRVFEFSIRGITIHRSKEGWWEYTHYVYYGEPKKQLLAKIKSIDSFGGKFLFAKNLKHQSFCYKLKQYS